MWTVSLYQTIPDHVKLQFCCPMQATILHTTVQCPIYERWFPFVDQNPQIPVLYSRVNHLKILEFREAFSMSVVLVLDKPTLTQSVLLNRLCGRRKQTYRWTKERKTKVSYFWFLFCLFFCCLLHDLFIKIDVYITSHQFIFYFKESAIFTRILQLHFPLQHDSSWTSLYFQRVQWFYRWLRYPT